MRRRHLRNARSAIRRAADATTVQDVDDHLDAIDGALAGIDRWADESDRRLERLRGQLEAMEERIEPGLRDDLRQARASLRAYSRRLDR